MSWVRGLGPNPDTGGATLQIGSDEDSSMELSAADIKTLTPRCASCVHWAPEKAITPPHVGICSTVLRRVAVHPGDEAKYVQICLRSKHDRELLENYEDTAVLRTAADFGCTLWAAKKTAP